MTNLHKASPLPAAAQEDRAFRLMPPIGYSAYCSTRSNEWNRRFENLEIVPVTMKHSHHDQIGGYCVPMTPAVRDFAGDQAMRLSGLAARQLECLNDNDFPGSDRCHVLVFRDSPPYAFMSAALYERFKAERSPSIVSGEVSPAATAFEEAARDPSREEVARPEPAAAHDFEDWLDGLKQEGELGETTVLGKDVVVISRAALAALWRRAAAPGAAPEPDLPQAVRKASNGSRKPNGHTPFAS